MTGAEPTRAEVDTWTGTRLLEFGASWCGYCKAARPLIDAALARHPGVQRLWVEDGKGRPLGRSYAVKLWPTLILLENGREVRRVVRPASEQDVLGLFAEPAA